MSSFENGRPMRETNKAKLVAISEENGVEIQNGDAPGARLRRRARMPNAFGWANLREPWKRLRWARSLKYETAKAAAEALGIHDGTYRAYERAPGASKATKLDHHYAMRFARKFGVRWEWLLHREGQPWPDTAGNDRGARVLRVFDGAKREDQERIAAVLQAMLGQ